MTGTFTLSLDCEGLWGMADQPEVLQRGEITSASLQDAYEFIAGTLGRNNITATAAFVSAFSCQEELLRELLPELEALDALCRGWLTHVLPRVRDGSKQSMDGLAGHGFFRRLLAEGHEMGWHGATHLPLGPATPAEAVEQEVRIGARMNEALGVAMRSVVFPRNRIGHLQQIRALGFTNYRAAPASGPLARVAGLAMEFCCWQAAPRCLPQSHEGWCAIPAGSFLNWPRGARSCVPVGVTVQRWTSMLRSAAMDGGTVHMWFHPHNLITAPAMRESFSRIIEQAGELVRIGDLVNATMADLEARRAGSIPHEH